MKSPYLKRNDYIAKQALYDRFLKKKNYSFFPLSFFNSLRAKLKGLHNIHSFSWTKNNGVIWRANNIFARSCKFN